jgi:Ssp1 endopeptidase immunity protein Rap1a
MTVCYRRSHITLRSIGLVAWIAIALSLPNIATAQRGTAFYTGGVIYQWCTSRSDYLRSRCMVYIVAIADAMAGSSLYGRTACIPLSVTGEKFIDAAVQYLRRNSAKWHNQAAILIAETLSDAFPCR